MEFANIEKLLEAYFDGNTTLAEEAELRNYFNGSNVAPQFENYRPFFAGIEAARNEVSEREVLLVENTTRTSNKWWYGVAASAAIVIAVAGFVFSEPSISQEEQEALTALNESKKAMFILSENFNKGAGKLALVDHFTTTKNRILK
jgi:hypothetical protein